MIPSYSKIFAAVAAVTTAASATAATTVGFANFTPSTTMTAQPGFPLGEINDGITGSNTNGFVSNSVGVITFTFSQDHSLASFLLWNDVDVRAEGIDQFQLRFFDLNSVQISPGFIADFVGPVGQTAPEEYVFPTAVTGVRSVELEVLTTQFNFPGPVPRTEIREVDFGLVPEPSSALLVILFGIGCVCRRNR